MMASQVANQVQPPPRRGLPWSLLASLVLLAGGAVGLRALQSDVVPWPDALWPDTLCLFAAAVPVLLLVGWLAGYGWGLAAALIVLLHPAFVDAHEYDLLPMVLDLALAVAVLAGWRLLEEPVFSVRSAVRWALLGAVLIAGLALLWPLTPAASLMASVMVLVGLGMAAVLGWQLRRRGAALSRISVILAGVSAFVIPAAGYFLAIDVLPEPPGIPKETDMGDRLRAAIWLDRSALTEVWSMRGPQRVRDGPSMRAGWGWPWTWVVLPLVICGVWRAVRRGLLDRRRGRLPDSWLLPLLALLGLLQPLLLAYEWFSPLLLLAALAIILSVYCVADVARGFGERLVLEPRADGGKTFP